jgi:uncharacterized protein YndB with AHSA1/START domain
MSRELRLDIEVPGTPDEVWDTIATGHGITSWFVPTEVEEGPGGTVKHYFTPEAFQTGRITAWEPPQRLVYESEQGERRFAYEWTVEGREGGTCVVRLVNSGFLDGADWDAEYESLSQGWQLFMYNLRLCRTYFPGQRCASSTLSVSSGGPVERAWAALMEGLGLPTSFEFGDRVQVAATDAPLLAGGVERFHNHMLSLRIDDPAPGIAFIAAEGGDDSVALSVYIYAFGATASDVMAGEAPRWRDWLGARFQSWPSSSGS